MNFAAVRNVGWLTIEKLLRIPAAVLTTVIIARYLGPNDFGALSYAMALLSLFAIFGGLGLNQILLREFNLHAKNADQLMTASVTAIFFAATFSSIIINIIALTFLDPNVASLVAVGTGILYLKISDVLFCYFDADVRAKVYIKPQLLFLTIAVLVKISLVQFEFSVIYFMLVNVLEPLGVILTVTYKLYIEKHSSLANWKLNHRLMKKLLKDSWPLAITALAVSLYMKVDQLMIGSILGLEEVASYTIAVKITEMTYFIPSVIILSYFPQLQKTYAISEKEFEHEFRKIIFGTIIFTILIISIVTIAADDLILLLYGENYSSASDLIKIYILNLLFVSFGIVGGKWYILKNLQKISMYRAFLGVFINIPLNLIFIEHFGANGAAISSVISFSIVGLFSDLILPQTRRVFKLKIQSLAFPLGSLK